MLETFTLRRAGAMRKINCCATRYGLDPAAEFRLIAGIGA
jgi:hypothetical protein